ncbi:MAG: hypothetical protein LBS48_03630 [Treponema sp.]|nr:hypothetical protein [Treponema sp.]
MNVKKNILIVTDGAESTVKMAEALAVVLKGSKVTVKDAAYFEGIDLLPVDAFFIGCEVPTPSSFGYIEELLQHINLAGRSCGVFSPGSKQAAQYLARIIRDSGAALNPAPLFAAGRKDLNAWAEKVIANNF